MSAIAAAGSAEPVELAAAWPRYWARALDLFLWLALLAVAAGALVPQITELGGGLGQRVSDQILGLILMPFAMACDALTYCLFGNTPGKRLAGLRVCDAAGGKLPALRYLARNGGVWINGLALGVGIVALFTLVHQYRCVGSGALTSWDRRQESRVVRVRRGFWRTPATATIYLVLTVGCFALGHYLGNLSPQEQLEFVASAANPRKPTMVDDTVRIDRVYVAPGLVLEYDYTVLGMSAADAATFAEQLEKAGRADLVRQFCTDFTMVSDLNGRMRWRYADENGRLLHAIEVSKTDCPAPAR